MSGNIDNVIGCAVTYASDHSHEYVTLEHLAFCLLEDDDVLDILQHIDCDWESAKTDLENYLKDEEFNGLKGETVYDAKLGEVLFNISGIDWYLRFDRIIN